MFSVTGSSEYVFVARTVFAHRFTVKIAPLNPTTARRVLLYKQVHRKSMICNLKWTVWFVLVTQCKVFSFVEPKGFFYDQNILRHLTYDNNWIFSLSVAYIIFKFFYEKLTNNLWISKCLWGQNPDFFRTLERKLKKLVYCAHRRQLQYQDRFSYCRFL